MALPPIVWYLLVTVIGLVTFPLAYHLLPALRDRGYAFSRALGLLLWGYSFWLLSSLGILSNDRGGILFAFILLLGLVYWAWRKIPNGELGNWFKENWKMVVTVEALFLLAFTGLIFLRAMEPNIIGTEKPMELAFLNALLRSPSMPPHDPWLADYAISYYYFGYVMVSMLAQISGVSGGVAFNLGISVIFAMTAIGAYGIVYNLLAALRPRIKLRNAMYSLLGPLFVLVVSNVEGFLEILHGWGLFWRKDASGEWVSQFWKNLNLLNLKNPPLLNTITGERRFWWWWRASRVIRDCGMPVDDITLPNLEVCFGKLAYGKEMIDEFPFFSYYLADLHPHVLVMPFVFLAVALTLNMFLSKGAGGFRIFNLKFGFNQETFLLGAVVFGGLAFLNIWDFPWQVGIFAAAYILRQAKIGGWRWKRVTEFLVLGVAFGITGVAAYLPFYISFSSQAGGILPNLIYPTRGAQLWIMFGTLFVPIFFYLAYLVLRKRDKKTLVKGLLRGLGVTLALYGASLLVTFFITRVIPYLGQMLDKQNWSSAGALFIGSYGVENLNEILQVALARRAETFGGLLTLTLLIGLAFAAFGSRNGTKEEINETELEKTSTPSHKFAVLLILFGGLLVLIPEFIFLRDQFDNRMNTIFKFYFQAWMLWGVAAAYGSAVLLRKSLRSAWTKVYSFVLVVVLWIGLAYPTMAVDTRLNNFKQNPENVLQLDGAAHSAYLSQEDKAAVAWLQTAPLGTLVEAVGGSYTHYARISTHSGQPSLLGWPGHESQWRGGGEEKGSREQDISRLYTTNNWAEAKQIIQRYGIRYIYIGALERTTYDVHEGKFIHLLQPVFQFGSVTIYEVPELENPMPGN